MNVGCVNNPIRTSGRHLSPCAFYVARNDHEDISTLLPGCNAGPFRVKLPLSQFFVYEATMGSVTRSLLNIENFTKFAYKHFHHNFLFTTKFFRFKSNEAVVLKMCDPFLGPL